jgi:trimethylamine--corrinoid protein Co-methyltransferase
VISDDTLMLDLIDRIGPGGEFLSTLETARRCRTEIWNPKLMDRRPWPLWLEAGAPTTKERIQERLQKILLTHKPTPLPDGVAESIESILKAAEARVG